MTNILISLVSEQTIPNVLFIKEIIKKNIFINKYIFITTEKMENINKSDSILDGTGIIGKFEVKKIVVNPDDYSEIISKLKELKFGCNDKLYVNITGGNKLMSIACFSVFKILNAEIFYLPIGLNKIEKLYPEDSAYIENLNTKIDLYEYLKSSGLEIINNPNDFFEKDQSKLSELFKRFITLDRAKFYQDLNALKQLEDISKHNNQSLIESANHIITHLGYNAIEKKDISNKLIKYFTGGWFEEYVYYVIKNKFSLKDEEISLNIEIRVNSQRNEFDILFVKKNILYYVECKTAMTDTFQNIKGNIKQRTIINETIYKIGSLQKKFGLNAKSYLISLDNNLRNKSGEINNLYLNRAKEYNITIIDKQILESDKDLSKILL